MDLIFASVLSEFLAMKEKAQSMIEQMKNLGTKSEQSALKSVEKKKGKFELYLSKQMYSRSSVIFTF